MTKTTCVFLTKKEIEDILSKALNEECTLLLEQYDYRSDYGITVCFTETDTDTDVANEVNFWEYFELFKDICGFEVEDYFVLVQDTRNDNILVGLVPVGVEI